MCFSKSFKINFIGVIIWSSRKPVFNLIIASFAFSTEFQQAQEECDHVHVENCGGDDVFLWGQALHDQSCVVDDIHAVEHCKANRNHAAHSRHGKEYLIKEKKITKRVNSKLFLIMCLLRTITFDWWSETWHFFH